MNRQPPVVPITDVDALLREHCREMVEYAERAGINDRHLGLAQPIASRFRAEHLQRAYERGFRLEVPSYGMVA